MRKSIALILIFLIDAISLWGCTQTITPSTITDVPPTAFPTPTSAFPALEGTPQVIGLNAVVWDSDAENLAYGKNTKASLTAADSETINAVDENLDTYWSAGEGPKQWFHVQMGRPTRITEIRLIAAQDPKGYTLHRIRVLFDGAETFVTVHEFDTFTFDGAVLVFKPDNPLENVRQVRIVTLESPSKVAWREVQIFGETQD